MIRRLILSFVFVSLLSACSVPSEIELTEDAFMETCRSDPDSALGPQVLEGYCQCHWDNDLAVFGPDMMTDIVQAREAGGERWLSMMFEYLDGTPGKSEQRQAGFIYCYDKFYEGNHQATSSPSESPDAIGSYSFYCTVPCKTGDERPFDLSYSITVSSTNVGAALGEAENANHSQICRDAGGFSQMLNRITCKGK